MTALTSHFKLFILFICIWFSRASLHRRFSDFKRCADDECSMLLCRGKASQDFTGPDCRFLSFKKGETIYVYYKLSGQRSDVWAGSVGNSFGYFPKDFLNINHIYTEKEIEVSAEETDFVCFDTGLDKFESYDIDVLLRNSLVKEVHEPSDKTEEVALSEDAVKDGETEETSRDIVNSDSLHTGSEDEHTVDTEDDGDLQDSETAQLPLETTASYEEDKDSYVVSDTGEGIKKRADGVSDLEQAMDKDMPDKPSPNDAGVLEKSDHTTQVEAFSELKTSLGTTFDAVTSDDENTRKVTPYDDDDEDQSNDIVEQPSEAEEEHVKEPSLLTFEEKPRYFEDKVPEATKSEDKHVPFQKEEMALSEDAVKDGETEETSRDIVNSDSLHTESKAEHTVDTEDDGDLRDSETAQLPLETTASYEKEKDSSVVKKRADGVSDLEQAMDEDLPDKPSPNDAGVLEKSDHTTQVEAFSELKTSLGTTFDAVTSDDENTQKVTPYDDDDEDQSNDLVEQPSEAEEERVKEPSLLTFEEKPRYLEDKVPEATKSEDKDVPLQPPASVEATKDDSMWSTLGDTVFKIVSGGERTDLPEDDDDDEEDDTHAKTTEKDSDELQTILVHDSETNEVAEEMKPSINDSVMDSLNDNKYAEVQEQNADVLKHDKELEEIKGKSLHLDETLIDAVESEYDPPASPLEDVKLVLDKPNESFAEKNILKPNPSETESHKSEALFKEDAHSVPELEKQTDEQIDRVKNEIINLFEETLKTEKSEPDTDEEEEDLVELLEDENAVLSAKSELTDKAEEILEDENAVLSTKSELTDEAEEILEDENALLSTKSELTDETEETLEDENALLSTKSELTDEAEELEESTENTNLESQIEKNELVTPKQPHDDSPKQTNKNMSEQINHDGKTGMETLLDISVSSPDNENENEKSVESNGVDEIRKDSALSEEPKYSDNVLRLTLLRDHFKDDEIERILRHLTIKDLYEIEAMFTELDHQLNSARQSHSHNSEALEHALESIVEVSENAILDEIDRMLDAQEQRALDLGQQIDQVMIDEQAAVLDDFQEFAFYLHQKYSTSVPSVQESQSRFEAAENVSEEVENPVETIPLTEAAEAPEVHQEASELFIVKGQDGEAHGQDVGRGEDGGHFNKNEDIQAAFQDTAEIQRGPQAILENPLDILGFEIDPSSDSLDSSRASDFSDNNANYDQASTSASAQAWDFLLLASEFLGVYAEILMAALPEEWQPGPTFHGLPWKPVVATAAVGVLTVLVFMWRTVLAVKNRMYLLTEKQLAERIQQLVSEKSDVLHKVTELNNAIKQYEEKLNNSEESRSSLQKEFNELKTHYQDLNNQKEKLSVNFAHLCEKIANTQEENKTLNEKISTMHQGIKKYQKTLKVYDEERSKVQVLVDEAKLREDALKAQVLSFEKDNCALKEQKKSLLQDAKDWQEKHEKLSEEIKVYHKKHTELENALVHKENEIDVLSGCIAELKSLESCNDTELENDKNGDPLKLHIKQMMDVSRIKATLSVIEDERNRWFENFMAEQKARQELEEKFQKVIHDQTNLKNEKTHLENQYKNLQQRLEITTELYHQKENILHQKLTQEELERHEKESKLSEVDGRALQAEEELNRLRQKVKDMQEELQQNERSLKAEIAVQEKKAHENWLKARASERALIEERRECANLRQKIVECSDKMSDLEHTLYKSGPPDRHMPPLQRAGDSYGPSPVSGGAPSPPLMIEDPGRPPSGPVGRRSEPFGPRMLLDGHGRSADLGHPLPFRPELSAPRTSSPCTQDGSQIAPVDAKAEVTMQASTDPPEAISKSQRQGSFLPSPIRDSPVPASNALPKVYGPQPMGGALPPVMRPPNGHSPMIPPGPPFGPDTCYRPPHMDSYRPPFPLRPYGPIPPPFVHGPPLRDFPSMGPHPPPHGVHDFPPNFAGPQDLPFPPRAFPSGPLPPPGAMVPPAAGAHGPAPPTPLQPRDGPEMPHATDVPPEQRVAHDAPTPTVTEP
ncbi:transport and Golgi organization protein 1 homolog isoform X1 [Pangasianodon hypophthalmus]|uniref:transport and Golgi organization protein 1 homolog isoform X1 n=1 Tax=Pangasianodon hypophthalmus TaxID=310915 RepID=UPI0023070B95|nr:transport and Golgi organization protein 1 homolog isoform X1 [Pangasianodon hypophthalmus]